MSIAGQKRAARQVTVDELVAQFGKLCDKGLCNGRTNKVELHTMREDFAQLIRERVVTARTMDEAYPVAKARLPENRLPGPRAIVSAMRSITPERPVELKPAEDKPFFDQPVPAAGTYTLPGNDTRH